MTDRLNDTDKYCLDMFRKRIVRDKKLLEQEMLQGKTYDDIKEGFSRCIPNFIENKDAILNEIISELKTSLKPMDRLDTLLSDTLKSTDHIVSKWYLNYNTANDCANDLANAFVSEFGINYNGATDHAKKLIMDELSKYMDASEDQKDVLQKYIGITDIKNLKMKDVIQDAKTLGIQDLTGSKDKIINRIRDKAKYIKSIDVNDVYVCNKCGYVTTKISQDRCCPKCLTGKLRKSEHIKRLLQDNSDLDSVNTILYISRKEYLDIEEIMKHNEDLNIVTTARPFAKSGVLRLERDDHPYVYEFEWTSIKDLKLNIYHESSGKLFLIFCVAVELVISTDRDDAIYSDLFGNTLKYGTFNYERYNKNEIKMTFVDSDGNKTDYSEERSLVDFVNRFIVCNIGFNYRVITRDDTEHIEVERTHKQTRDSNKAISTQTNKERSVSRRKIYLDGIELYTYDKDVWNAVKNHKVIELDAWGVRSHVRFYKKTGKTVIIEAYTKGKEREKYKAEDLLQRRKTEIRGDKKNYISKNDVNIGVKDETENKKEFE